MCLADISQLSIGTLVGALAVAPIADRIGRKYSMSVWSTIFIIGVIIQMGSETSWVQIAIGRLVCLFRVHVPSFEPYYEP